VLNQVLFLPFCCSDSVFAVLLFRLCFCRSVNPALPVHFCFSRFSCFAPQYLSSAGLLQIWGNAGDKNKNHWLTDFAYKKKFLFLQLNLRE
jgi:hypothetical protein